jgi:hypothetical protein
LRYLLHGLDNFNVWDIFITTVAPSSLINKIRTERTKILKLSSKLGNNISDLPTKYWSERLGHFGERGH